MAFSRKSIAFALVLFAAAPVVFAQANDAGHPRPSATVAGSPAAQSGVPIPSVDSSPVYRSAFEGYRRFKEEPLMPWKEANDMVGRVGGWKAYAQEAQAGPTPGAEEVPAPSAQQDMSAAGSKNSNHGAHVSHGPYKQH